MSVPPEQHEVTPDRDTPAGVTPPPHGGRMQDEAAALAKAAADVVGHGARTAWAWLRLVQAEASLARSSMTRIALAAAVAVLAVFFTWVSAAVALGAAFIATGMPVALALALVFLTHVLVLVILALLMRHWSRSLGFPRTRAAFMSMVRGNSDEKAEPEAGAGTQRTGVQ